LPTIEVPLTELAAGMTVAALFVRAGLAGSNGEVRRAVANSALSVNDSRVSDAAATLTAADLNADGVIKLSHGRKKHVLVKALEDGASWV
jgi:tyrosyl-tRNA synthetase